MKDVLKALDRKEKITILYHGKVKGVIVPVNNKKYKKVKDHPFFGMLKDNNVSVSKEMQDLRGPIKELKLSPSIYKFGDEPIYSGLSAE